MNNKPKESFSISLGDAELNITGQEYENLETATLELNTGVAMTSEVPISVKTARDLVRQALENKASPMKHYTEETKRIAHEWAGLEYEGE